MKLSMELQPALKQELNQELKQDLALNQKMRLELKQELALKLGMKIGEMMNEIIGQPTDLLKVVINEILSNIENESLRAGLELLMDDPMMRTLLIENRGNLAVLTEKKVIDFSINYIYEKNKEQFTLKTDGKSENGEDRGQDVEITKGLFRDAMINPSRQKEQVESLRQIANKDVEGYKTTIAHIHEMESSLQLADSSRESVDMIKQAIIYIMQAKDNDGSNLVMDFVRELIMVEKFNVVISERIQKRFAASFSRVTEMSDPKRHENAFLNTIGEYVLSSVGIIDPGLFNLQKAQLNNLDSLKSDLKECGIDLDEMLKRYSLNNGGTIFWNRWKTIGIKPSRITDEKVREFITQTVRMDAPETLAACQYHEIFESIRESAKPNRKVEDVKERLVELRKLITEFLMDDKINDALKKIIKEKWYPKLDMFYSAQNKNQSVEMHKAT